MNSNLDPYQPLFDFLGEFVTLPDEFKVDVKNRAPIQSFTKGEHLLHAGNAMRNIYFPISGCVRMYFLEEDDEITTRFFEEREPIAIYQSFETKEPSEYSLQCIEDSSFVVISYDLDKYTMEHYDFMPHFDRLRLRTELRQYSNMLRTQAIKDSTKRYLDFQKKYPHLLLRIPMNQLASYLGMRPETLSRIRKKLSSNH